MKKYALKNGLTLVACCLPTDSVAIQATVKVGSNYETDRIRGISHFIEHLLFEGTTSRTGQEIASAIEGVGGSFGAFTSNTRTGYHIKILKKHLGRAVEILADMLMHPAFNPETIEKERSIILSEIKTRQDEPHSYQWELFHRTLFTKNNAQHPVIGYPSCISSITRKDLMAYFKKHYSANNIILTLCGNFSDAQLKEVIQTFEALPSSGIIPYAWLQEPRLQKVKETAEQRRIQHSYLVLGYPSVSRAHEDSYTLDVIEAILGMPLSGRLFRHIRQEKALCYDIGVYHDADVSYGCFAVHLSTDKSKLAEAQQLLLDELHQVDSISRQELDDAKNYIEGSLALSLEDTERRADTLGFWEYAGGVRLFTCSLQKIRAVTQSDLTRVKKKYFQHHAMAVIKQDTPR